MNEMDGMNIENEFSFVKVCILSYSQWDFVI